MSDPERDPGRAPGPDGRFGDRLLAERAAVLATRGLVPEARPAAEADRIVCESGGVLFAIAPDAVRTVRASRFEPVPLLRPAAAGIVLGVVLVEGRLVSVLSLARLFAVGNAGAASGGVMLMLRAGVSGATLPDLALQADRSLGLRSVEELADGRRARLLAPAHPGAAANAEPDAADRLALLIDARRIADAAAALEPSSFLPGA